MGVAFNHAPGQDQRGLVEELIARLTCSRDVPRIFVGRKEDRKASSNLGREIASDLATRAPAIDDEDAPPDPLLVLVLSGESLTPEQFQSDLRAQRTGERRDPRIDLEVPVLLAGTDVSGRPRG